MKCLFIGICQIVSLATILKQNPAFTNIYDEILVYTIFNITDKEMENIINNIVPTCDLVLSQPVSKSYRNNPIFSSYKLRQSLKPSATHLIVANCYFTGYDPCPFQTTDENGSIIHFNKQSYYPSICLEPLLTNDILQACKNWCNINAYSKQELDKNIITTLTELKNREKCVFEENFPVDIVISDYIENNYRNKFLFHTYNHPTNVLLYELARRILNRLGLPVVNLEVEKELLGDTSIPPCPSVYFQSNFTFEYPDFVIDNVKYNTKTAFTLLANSLNNKNIVTEKLINRWRSSIKYSRSKLL